MKIENISIKRKITDTMLSRLETFGHKYSVALNYSISIIPRPPKEHFLGRMNDEKRTILIAYDKHTSEYLLYMALFHELAHAVVMDNKQYTFLTKGNKGKYGKLAHEVIASEVQKECCMFFIGIKIPAKYESKFPTYFKIAKKYEDIINRVTHYICSI